MSKGAEAKKRIIEKMLQAFPGSFMDADGKTLRIPETDVGKDGICAIEVKVALTCAKDVLGVPAITTESDTNVFDINASGEAQRKITPQDKVDIRKALEKMGI